MARLSKPMSRLAAVGLLFAAVAGLVMGVALPVAERFQALAGALEDERVQLRDYAAFAAQRPAVDALEERYQAELEQSELLPGDSEAEWRSGLQGMLTDLAQESGVRISSARRLPDRERGPFALVGMGLSLTADIETVQRFLHAVETARPYLFVESADISPLGGLGRSSGPRMLEVRLEVFAAPERGEAP